MVFVVVVTGKSGQKTARILKILPQTLISSMSYNVQFSNTNDQIPS
jgi:hypothetical protein